MFEIDVSERPGYLRFAVTGRQSPETDPQIDDAIARICVDREATAILIDIRALSGRLTVLENYMAASTFRRRVPPSVGRVAIVDLPEHQARSEMFELTAWNRGVRVRFFDCESAAEDWLGGDTDSP